MTKTFSEVMGRGLVNNMQSTILTAFKKNPRSTDREISRKLAMPINSVTGRRNELVKMGCIQEGLHRPCMISGRMARTWLVPQNIEFVYLRHAKQKVSKKCFECKYRQLAILHTGETFEEEKKKQKGYTK